MGRKSPPTTLNRLMSLSDLDAFRCFFFFGVCQPLFFAMPFRMFFSFRLGIVPFIVAVEVSSFLCWYSTPGSGSFSCFPLALGLTAQMLVSCGDSHAWLWPLGREIGTSLTGES